MHLALPNAKLDVVKSFSLPFGGSALDSQITIIIMISIFVGVAWYTSNSAKKQILCVFHRANKTRVEKKISMNDKRVIFDGGEYHVNIKRIELVWYDKGFAALFPGFRPSLTYKWDSQQPIDPATYRNTWDTPEARQAASSESAWKGFNTGMSATVGKKQSGIAQYLPWIAVAGVVIMGFFVYQMNGKMSILAEQNQNLGLSIQGLKPPTK